MQKACLSEKTNVSCEALKSSGNLSAIQTLYQLAASSRGPLGNMKMLQNQSGGHLTVTSSSKRLLNSLSVTKPVIQLLVSAAQGHLDAFSDGGLFLVSLATSLTITSLQSDLSCKTLSEIFEKFLTLCLQYLHSDICGCKVGTVLSNINFMKSIVRTVIQSKPLCKLNEEKLELISRLVIEAFLGSVSDTYSNIGIDNVHILCREGSNIIESKLLTGLIIQAPELSKYKSVKLSLKRHENEGNRIKVAVVTVSMSGDMEEIPDTQLEVWNGVDLDSVLVEQEMTFCQQIVECGVGMLFCQKVVHPKLKLELRQSGVLVLDRLGLNMVGIVCKITGASPIRSLLTAVHTNSFGWVDNAEHVIESRRSYLLLTKKASLISTLILCHTDEESLEELKDVCKTALHCLFLTLHSPFVLLGGCWQSILAQYLKYKIRNEKEALACELECSPSTVLKACALFTHALQMSALPSHCRNHYSISETDGHVYWAKSDECAAEMDVSSSDQVMCCCKFKVRKLGEDKLKNVCFETIETVGKFDMFSEEEATAAANVRYLVLDSFAVCVNALKTAILTACTVLRVGQVINNV